MPEHDITPADREVILAFLRDREAELIATGAVADYTCPDQPNKRQIGGRVVINSLFLAVGIDRYRESRIAASPRATEKAPAS